MIHKTLFALSIGAVLGFTLAASVDLKSAELAADGGYVITNGSCKNVPTSTLVSSDHVNLNAIPFYKRDHTTKYRGDKLITCVTVLNLKGTQHEGTAKITEGGWRHSFVTVYMESDRGYGIEFVVNIYAQ